MSPELKVKELLEQIRSRDRLHYSFKNNHAPMVLIAMVRLGASTTQLTDYFHKLSPEPKQSQSSITQNSPIEPINWKSHLGNHQAASLYCKYFESEISRHGRVKTLKTYLPDLMPGVAAHAFHPLIRISYGIEFDDDLEIAFGLGYWAATHQPGPLIPADRPHSTASIAFSTLANSPELQSIQPVSNSVSGRIQQFYDNQEFQNLLQPIDFPKEEPLSNLAAFIADSFVVDHHFSMLHGVTSCHALRTILPYCENLQQTINCYWTGVCALRLSICNGPELTNIPISATQQEWQTISKQALATRIEHTIKLTHTCSEESAVYEGEIWKRLADHEIKHPALFV